MSALQLLILYWHVQLFRTGMTVTRACILHSQTCWWWFGCNCCSYNCFCSCHSCCCCWWRRRWWSLLLLLLLQRISTHAARAWKRRVRELCLHEICILPYAAASAMDFPVFIVPVITPSEECSEESGEIMSDWLYLYGVTTERLTLSWNARDLTNVLMTFQISVCQQISDMYGWSSCL